MKCSPFTAVLFLTFVMVSFSKFLQQQCISVLITFWLQPIIAQNTGHQLFFQFLSYNNPTNTLSNGSCCVSDCSSCEPVYLFCIRGPGHSLSDRSNCPFGSVTHAGTGRISNNLFNEGRMYPVRHWATLLNCFSLEML